MFRLRNAGSILLLVGLVTALIVPGSGNAQPPAAPLPGKDNAARVPGYQQLVKFMFPIALPKTSTGGATALYNSTIDLWADDGLVFMDMKTGTVDWLRRNAWVEKWKRRAAEIKDDKDFDRADLLALLAVVDLGERFNYYLSPTHAAAEDRGRDPTVVGVGMRFELEGMRDLIGKLPKDASDEEREKALVTDDKHRLFLLPVPGSPAARAGVQDGDVLKAVDGEVVAGKTLNEVAALIKGKEGTKVELEVERKGKDGKQERLKVTVTRSKFTFPVVHVTCDPALLADLPADHTWKGDARLTNATVRIVLDNFTQDSALREMETALKTVAMLKLSKSRPVKVVFDLRGNPGGRLDYAINIVSWLLPEGTIVSLKERRGNSLAVSRWTATRDALVYTYPAPASPASLVAITAEKRVLLLPEDVPLVVLVDDGSYSASELTAGALLDRRALVVGTTTGGKGVGQQIFELPDKRRAKVIKFAFLPADRDIDWVGVQPSPGWEVPWKEGSASGDNQLEAAVKAALAEYERIEGKRAHEAKGRERVTEREAELRKTLKQKEDDLNKRLDELGRKNGGAPVGPGVPPPMMPPAPPPSGN